MPSMSISHAVALNTPIEDAWSKLQLEETWAGIGPISYVSNPRHNGDGTLAGFAWGANVGGKMYPGTATTVEATAPTLLVLDMDTSEIGGRITAELTRTGATCQITVTMDVTTKGMLSAMFFPAIKGALNSGLPQQVEELATRI